MASEDIKKIWLPAIWDMFVKYGLHSTSMDDIASHLKVSKKTLYQFFENKDDLIEQVMMWVCSPEKIKQEHESLKYENPINLLCMIKYSIFKNMNEAQIPAVFFDLKKYHPRVYSAVDHILYSVFSKILSDIVARGVEEGYFQKNTDSPTQIWLVCFVIRIIREPEINSKIDVPIKKIISAVIDNFILGISTTKGIAEFEKIKQTTK